MTPSPAIIEALKRVEPDADGFHAVGGSQYQSTTSHKSYFVKEGSPSEAEQYHGEAESLRAMYAASPGICPKVFECSLDRSSSKRPVFVSEYKNISPFTQTSAAALGTKLAEMHTRGTSPTGRFGFAVPTYCGATRMENGWFDTWEAAYDQMIGGLLDHLKSKGGYQKTCELGEEVRARVIPRLLGPLRIQPALLHGDLWNGNAGTDTDTGQPVIFDPSSYYGHNEADLSIARIFGGFPRAFFTAYQAKIPPTEPVEEYDQRAALYEIFHYLNHTVLFGRSYESSAKQRMIQLLQYVRENEQTSSL